ncbi:MULTISPECIES: WYL domain-containing protein [Janibacter]|uniref:helix-turn-helix transcriptional regulator n=1 Tax=Janibacter TaxID=53457 RepID=UPI00082C557B|nr:WYL domain-containing protein [Janibacter terrae]
MAAPNTPAAKTERLLNLTMSLLSARIPVPKQRIRTMVEAYHLVESDEAFDRMFERDKEDLRAMGIPLVTEDIGIFEDEQGYRIDQREYALPPVELAADERAVVGLASRAWAHAAMAGTAATAWRKVAADDEVGEDPFAGLEPRLGGAEPAFEPLKDAVLASVRVRFDYARPGADGAQTRHVEPWYLTAWHGRWYLVGHDLDREAPRVFRLSRIASAVTTTREAVTGEIPEDVDPVRMIAAVDGDAPQPSESVLRVRVDAGHGLRRRATSVESIDEQWDRVVVDHGGTGAFAGEIASHGADVVVEGPAELREAVVARLRSVLETHEGSPR